MSGATRVAPLTQSAAKPSTFGRFRDISTIASIAVLLLAWAVLQ